MTMRPSWQGSTSGHVVVSNVSTHGHMDLWTRGRVDLWTDGQMDR